ncbi:hypothetical protein TZ03_01355 [Pseudomonas sp. 10-1B]|nr:hypothetical protein TZ03_01355 [Pseudomonas sp. 10-1B]
MSAEQYSCSLYPFHDVGHDLTKPWAASMSASTDPWFEDTCILCATRPKCVILMTKLHFHLRMVVR